MKTKEIDFSSDFFKHENLLVNHRKQFLHMPTEWFEESYYTWLKDAIESENYEVCSLLKEIKKERDINGYIPLYKKLEYGGQNEKKALF